VQQVDDELSIRRNMRDLLRSGMETNKRRVAKFPKIGNELIRLRWGFEELPST